MPVVSRGGHRSGGSYTTTYTCKICGESFYSQSAAEEHIKVSHPIALRTTYKCTVCGELFLEKSEVEQHVRTKHPELFRPSFKCKICKKSFSTQDEFKTHLIKEHSELFNPVACPACGEKFTLPKLLIHLQQCHPEFLGDLQNELE